jgi:IS605 OrfB family transposase
MSTYAVQSNVIRGLSKKQYALLKEMCRYSNSLYNVALYNIRQHYFDTKMFLTYESNYHECKTNENYKLLQAGVAQQTMKVVDRSFKSFFNLLKKCKVGDYRYHDVKIPHYRKSGGLFNLVLSTNAIIIRGDYLMLPMSREFRALHPEVKEIAIPFPKRLSDKTIKEVRILPCGNGRVFKIQYVYEVAEEPINLNKDNVISIDIGIDNLATCIPTIGTPFIMDGRKLKSTNHQWNKEMSRLRSIAMKQNLKTTNRIQRITAKRNNQVNDCIKKTARYIIDYCIENDIGSLVVGYNADFKRNSNIGKVNNQNFVQIPLGDLRNQLSFLCWKYGIDYIEQEESYTSKSSFLDKDVLPEYKPEQPYKGKFSGKRICRGLYRSANGTIVNADVNGAANIMRKCKQNVDFDKLCLGLLASPVRIRLQ